MECNKDEATRTSTSQQHYTCAPRNEPSGTSYQHIRHRTPAAAATETFVGSEYNRSPRHPASHQPLDPTPHVPYYPQTPATGTHVRPPIAVPMPPFQCAPFMYQPTTFSPRPSRPETFWTSCSRCRTLFEYHKIFLNQNLPCPCCRQPFLAMEMPAPKVNSRSSCPWPFPRHYQNVFVAGSSGFTSVPASSAAGVSRSAPCHSSDERLKKSMHEEKKAASASDAVGGLGGEKPVKKRCTNLSQTEIRVMLMEKGKMEIIGLLNEWEAEESKSHVRRVATKASVKTGQSGDGLSRDPTSTVQPRKSLTLEATDDDESVAMMVPDANFHNFDEERIEASFSANQVWAAYDDDDGMPRYYALVHHVVSRKPFNIQISWLNSRSSSEFGSLNWIGSGFTKTCGGFRVGKYVVVKRLSSFSHPVKWKKGRRGAIQIYPTKGDVWAMYRNWSPDWIQATTDETMHKYDVVVVLEDFNEDVGVTVAPLVKVAGFTSVFNLDEREIHTIPREEMFRFSHQVPIHILNGQEAENSPEGCYELDPAALPLELLEVITDAGSS